MFLTFLFKIVKMADNQSRMTLSLHASIVVESNGNVSGEANTSAAVEPEASVPGVLRIPVVDMSNPLLHIAGLLPQVDEVLGNDSDGAAAQASNLGVSNGATVDRDDLLATSAMV